MAGEATPMHLDGKSIADAINEAVAAALAGPIIVNEAANVAHASAAASTASVVHPANAAYTQADQTALANVVVAIGVNVADLVAKVNAIEDSLVAAGIMHA